MAKLKILRTAFLISFIVIIVSVIAGLLTLNTLIVLFTVIIGLVLLSIVMTYAVIIQARQIPHAKINNDLPAEPKAFALSNVLELLAYMFYLR